MEEDLTALGNINLFCPMMYTSLLSAAIFLIVKNFFLGSEITRDLSAAPINCQSEVKRYQSNNDSTYITGLFIECETGLPIRGATFGIDKKIVEANEKGRFKKYLRPGGYEFSASTVGYYGKKINLELLRGDSLSIVIYLDRDTRPLH